MATAVWGDHSKAATRDGATAPWYPGDCADLRRI